MNRSEHLKNLNPQQLEAVLHVDGPLLIFAGAGSGKTRVLTRRIAHLVLENNVRPSEILAVTFTNKAAAEMKERVAGLFAGQRPPSWVSTFHATCARILRRHAEMLNFKQNFVIYDTSDQLSSLKRVYRRLSLDPKILEPRRVASAIDRAKNNYLSPDDLKQQAYNPNAEQIADIYQEYQRELLSANAMDFGDLLCNVVTLFELEQNVLNLYHEKFRYMLIDEYQDTNHVQYRLVRALSMKHKNICVVGDDDQSIYSFRGATIQNILTFQEDFPDAKVVTLEQNYRSTQNILRAASSVIALNKERQVKTLFTENDKGNPVICLSSYDELEEAERIADEALRLMRNGITFDDMAIFYRTNAQSRAIEEALIQAGINYEIYGGHRFYDRKEIKDILAYLRILHNEADNEAFLRIINVPTRGLGITSVNKLVELANSQGQACLPALRNILNNNAKLLGAAAKRYADFINLIDKLAIQLETATILLADQSSQENFSLQRHQAIASLLDTIASESGYFVALKKEDTVEAESRTENIRELFNVATEYVVACDKQNMQASITGFLERASLSSDLDAKSENPNRLKGTISLMTLHLAKGLEFDVVFLTGMEEGLLPHVRAMDIPEDLEEERRLCYVGMTRARKILYLTRASSRQSYGKTSWFGGTPSRFIYDLPDSVLDDRGTGFIDYRSEKFV